MCRVHAAVDIFDCMRGLMVQTYLCFDPMAAEGLALLMCSTHNMAKLPPSPHIFPLLPKITTRSPHFGFGNMLRGSVSSYFDPFYNTKLSPAPSFARRTHTTSPIFFIFWYPQFRAHKHVPADYIGLFDPCTSQMRFYRHNVSPLSIPGRQFVT